MLCYLADIPLRLAHCRENPYQLLTDWVPETEPGRGIRHEVRRQLDLVATVGARPADERLSLRVPDAARARIDGLLATMGVEAGSPGSSSTPARRPPRGATRRSRSPRPPARLVRDHGCRVVFTGDASERPLVESIRAAMGAPSHSLAGRLDLAELAALIERAPLLIANNTGPGPRRRGGRHAGRRPVRPDEPAAHALGRAQPRPEPRRAVQALLQERLPRGASRLPAARRARRGRPGGRELLEAVAAASASPDGTPSRL